MCIREQGASKDHRGRSARGPCPSTGDRTLKSRPQEQAQGLRAGPGISEETSGLGFLAFASAYLRGVRVGGGARAEDPADHHPDQQDRRDVYEVRRCRHQDRPVRFTSASRRATSCCTVLSRRATDTMYRNTTTITNEYAPTTRRAAGICSAGGS